MLECLCLILRLGNICYIATLIGLCFSTARGIIFEKLNNSGIPNILLPVVSPQEMLQKASNQSQL
jgi:prolyl-tRNA synthetase